MSDKDLKLLECLFMKTPPPLRYWVQRYMVYALSVVISILLLLNVFLIYQNSLVIEYNKSLQEETEKIKVNTVDIIRGIHQADMGLRAYALIRVDRQLFVTRNGMARVDSIFQLLEKSLSSQHFPMEKLAVMEDSTHLYFKQLEYMITLVDQGRRDEFNRLMYEDRGYYTYQTYLNFANIVTKFENEIGNQALARYNRARRNSYIFQIILFLVTVPALVYMLYLFREKLRIAEELRKAESRAVEILAAQNEQLERQVQARTNEILAQNEEIASQNEEITSHNEQLLLHQNEIARQRNILVEKNAKLEEAYKTIEAQHNEIQAKNKQLTEEVNLQTRDLKKTNLELIEQNSRLEQFAYIISHNMRAPMARLIGLSSLFQRATSDEEKSEIVSLMIKSTADFDNVIKDLSQILSIQKLNTEVYSAIVVEDIVKKVIEMLEPDIKATNAKITYDFSKAPTLYSLSQYIESIFFNLISNALKYRHPDRSPVVTIKSRSSNNIFQLTISDNGLGFNLDRYKDSVFNLYKRFHFHVEGKGLGLYLVRTQVEALGGRIKLESKPDAGSVFKIEFKENAS